MRTEQDFAHRSSAQRPLSSESLSAKAVELTAQRLRVIADPTRIALLEALTEGPAAVQDLAERVGLTHQSTSHHLLLLHQAGILSRRRDGKLSRYAVVDWSALWVVEQIARGAESCQGSKSPSR